MSFHLGVVHTTNLTGCPALTSTSEPGSADKLIVCVKIRNLKVWLRKETYLNRQREGKQFEELQNAIQDCNKLLLITVCKIIIYSEYFDWQTR